MRHNKKGFTLLELLAVLVILAALATIAIPIFLNKGDDARIAAHVENLRVINDAIQRYEWEYGTPTRGTVAYYDLITPSHDLITKGFLTADPTNPFSTLSGSDTKKSAVYVIGINPTTNKTEARLVVQSDNSPVSARGDALHTTADADESEFIAGLKAIDSTGTLN